MKQAIAVVLGVSLSIGTVSAQPSPESGPTDGQGPAKGTKEKASNETLQEGGGTQRPWAVGVSQAQQQQALKLFREGNQHHNDGLFKKAVELYQEALKSWDHPAIHYNLALSLMNLDRPIDVETSLQKAIKYGPAPLAKDKFDHAKEYLLLIQQQLATVEVICKKLGAKVSVDGREVFTVGPTGPNAFKSRVRIGKHTFVAEKPGYNAEIEAPFIGPGETFRIELKLYTAEELTRTKRRWDATWMPYAVIGGGIALGLAGGALQLSADSSYREFDDAVRRCSEAGGMNAGCEASAELADMRESGDTKRMLGYVGYGIAGAAVVTGAVLLYLNRSTTYQITADEYKREQREQQKTAITPIVAPGMAGAMVYGRF